MASRSLGSLTIDLIARTFGFEQGMDKAARTAEKRMKEIEARAKKFGAVVGTALVAGAGIVANQLRNTINQMDELSKAAQRASLPTEEFSKLAYAGELADVSIQDLQASLGRLAKAQADAEKSTSTQGRIFEALGISTKNAEGNLRSTYEVFLDFADAFKEYQGSPEIVAAGLNIFGRSFQNLIPLLKDGSEGLKAAGIEAEQLGLVLSDEAGRQAEQFNDDLTRLQSALTGLWREVASQVLPQLIQLSGEFVKAAKDGETMKNIADQLAQSLRAVADTAVFFSNLISRLGELRSLLAGLENTLSKFSLGNLSGVGDQVRSLLPEWLYSPIGGSRSAPAALPSAPGREMDPTLGAPLSPAELSARNSRLRRISGAFGDAQRAGSAGKSKEQQEAEQLKRAYDSLIESMDERIALFGKEGEAVKVRYDTEFGALAQLSPELKANAIARAEQYDQMVLMQELQEAANDAVERETEAYRDNQQAIRDMISDMEFELALIGMTNSQREKEIALRYAGAEATDEQRQRIGELIDAQREAALSAERWDAVQSSLANSMYDAISGAESLTDAVKGFFDELNAQILRMITEGWAEQITDLFRGASTGNQGGNNGFMGVFSSLFGSIFGGGRATGGPFSAGRVYQVNESGMEMATVRGRDYLLTGGSSGTITPAHKVGGGMAITQNFINPVLADRRSETQREAEAARRLRRVQRYA